MAVAEFIVSFREFFEISLLIGIMLAYLRKADKPQYVPSVWTGAAVAAAASVAVALLLNALRMDFDSYEMLFEGATLILAAVLVTWFIFWMFGQKHIARQIETGMRHEVELGAKAGVAVFSFIAVFREGMETVLFLEGINIETGKLSLLGVLVGALAAIALAYLVFRHIVRLDLKSFFNATSVILILLAAGLVSQGVHELNEAGVMPTIVEHAWDFTPSLHSDGTYPALHPQGEAGSILRGLTGYDTAPSLMQVIAYWAYLVLVLAMYRRIETAHGRG